MAMDYIANNLASHKSLLTQIETCELFYSNATICLQIWEG